MPEESRFLLGIAYQAGRDPRIMKGADGSADFFTADELEKAAWAFTKKHGGSGLFHEDGTGLAAEVVESYIYRGDPWMVDASPGCEVIVKAGDWLIGCILSPEAWALYKSGQITGFSPQGSAKRRKATS
ncbi:XkdF-like putative serine protease domain-containing protein [Subtercola vilae]|uniref:Phage-like element PBSX protein XkdF domain-containing protein n=1 Tax=Subtercola vilae TaxID=2056433 RepID=A0A4T2BU40_9MICO|nr:XkdF-like putative serine protease domain-containing protein [Subtercola vilae]TIH34967.1 hypothetical protein D4765_11785 [Subtercola vilae]